MSPVFRKIHRRLALWVAIPLLVTALTGLTYRLGRNWFGLSKETGNQILTLHTGEWLGRWGELLYVAVVGLGLLVMIGTGLTFLFTSHSKLKIRKTHRGVAFILTLPLIATAITGLIFKYGTTFFELPETTKKSLMAIHQGSWLGKEFSPFYVALLGLGLITMLWTGIQMSGLLRAKPKKHS